MTQGVQCLPHEQGDLGDPQHLQTPESNYMLVIPGSGECRATGLTGQLGQLGWATSTLKKQMLADIRCWPLASTCVHTHTKNSYTLYTTPSTYISQTTRLFNSRLNPFLISFQVLVGKEDPFEFWRTHKPATDLSFQSQDLNLRRERKCPIHFFGHASPAHSSSQYFVVHPIQT